MHHTTSPARLFAWGLTSAASLLAIYVWGSSVAWQVNNLSIYLVFPLPGLLAFSIMWTQYMAGFLHRTVLKNADLGRYFSRTGYTVLVLILLHPGLLAYQRWHDGFGLPPGSETSYVGPGMAWLVVLAMVCFLVFLAYELHRWFGTRSWWKYLTPLSDLAMLAIFYHGLRLGTQTHIGWFQPVWWFYGATLVIVIALNYAERVRRFVLRPANP